MAEPKNPRREVKERMLKSLTSGLSLNDEPGEYIENINDIDADNSYAIDIAIFETAKAILKDIEKADDPQNRAILVFLKKKWLVPVRKPEPNMLEISMPDWIYETPIGKKAAKEADEIVRSIEEHQKQLKEKMEKFVSSIEGMRISNRGNVGIGSGKRKRKRG